MQLACPKCGSRDARVAHRNGLAEWFRGLIGIYPLRCRRCNTRWRTSTWESAAWKYARCPKCYRQELSTWSEAALQSAPLDHAAIAPGSHSLPLRLLPLQLRQLQEVQGKIHLAAPGTNQDRNQDDSVRKSQPIQHSELSLDGWSPRHTRSSATRRGRLSAGVARRRGRAKKMVPSDP